MSFSRQNGPTVTTEGDSFNYQPSAMDNAIRYLNNCMTACNNANKYYTDCDALISAVESAGYSLPAGGKSLLKQAISELQTLQSDANKIKNKLSGEESSSGVNLEELYDDGGSSWSILDWDGDGKSFEWFQDLAKFNYNATVNNPYYGLDTAIPMTSEQTQNFITGDWDGDGKSFEWFQDLAEFNYNATVNNPYYGLDTPLPMTPEQTQNFVSGDWDGDGKSFEWFQDLAKFNYNATVNNPYYGLDTPLPMTPEQTQNFVSGDWDGDGESWKLFKQVENFDYNEFYNNSGIQPFVTDSGFVIDGSTIEFFTDRSYRESAVEQLVDTDNDGVRDYVEFAQDMSNFDYNEFYSQSFVTDSGVVITGDMLNFFADPFAGVIEFTGDVAVDVVVDPVHAANRVVSSVGNLTTAVAEGVSDWGEAVIDTALVLSSHSMAADMQMQADQYEIFGNAFGIDAYSQHADVLRESSEPIVLASAEIADRDYTDAFFDSLYSTQFYSNMNELAYSGAQRGVEDNNTNGILYNIFETVGYNVPTLLLTHGVKTYGGTGLAKATIQSLFTWAPSFGKNFEKKYGGEGTIESVNDAIFKSGTSATVDSLIVYLAGKISNLKIESNLLAALSKNTPGYNALPSSDISMVNIWKSLGINSTDVATFIKMLKPVVNEMIDTQVYGDDFTWEEDGVSVIEDMIGIWLAEEIAGYFGGFTPKFKPSEDAPIDVPLDPGMAELANAVSDSNTSSYYYDFINAFAKDMYKRVGKEGTSDLYEDLFIEYVNKYLGGGSNG